MNINDLGKLAASSLTLLTHNRSVTSPSQSSPANM